MRPLIHTLSRGWGGVGVYIDSCITCFAKQFFRKRLTFWAVNWFPANFLFFLFWERNFRDIFQKLNNRKTLLGWTQATILTWTHGESKSSGLVLCVIHTNSIPLGPVPLGTKCRVFLPVLIHFAQDRAPYLLINNSLLPWQWDTANFKLLRKTI